MKKVLPLILSILIVAAVIIAVILKSAHPYKQGISLAPNSPIASITTSSCNANQLAAVANFEAAAGNIYGTLIITNISNKDCNITLGNSIHATYSANNILTKYENSSPDIQIYMLKSGNKVYSQVH